MARTRHGLGKRLALRLITVAGLAVAAWVLTSSPATAASATPEPPTADICGGRQGLVSGVLGVDDGRIVPMKPIRDELRQTTGRLQFSVAEDADPISSIVAPMLSPALDVVVALTEPVVRAVKPVGEPLLLMVPLSHAMAVRGFVGEAFAATLEPVFFPEDDVIAPQLVTPRSAGEEAEKAETVNAEHRPGKRIRAPRHVPLIRMAADADHRYAETQLPLTEPAGGRTPMDVGTPTAPAAAPGVPGAQAGVLPAVVEPAEPGQTALRGVAHRAAERLVGDAPTSSPD